jgi:hypothetical protein
VGAARLLTWTRRPAWRLIEAEARLPTRVGRALGHGKVHVIRIVATASLATKGTAFGRALGRWRGHRLVSTTAPQLTTGRAGTSRRLRRRTARALPLLRIWTIVIRRQVMAGRGPGPEALSVRPASDVMAGRRSIWRWCVIGTRHATVALTTTKLPTG